MLTENRNVLPELLVQPEGLDPDSNVAPASSGEVDGPLLGLFRSQATLPIESFVEELRKQRGLALSASNSA